MVKGPGTDILILPRRVPAQEQHVIDFHRMLAPDFADHPRNRVRMAAAIQRAAGIVDVHAFERRGKSIGVAFAAHLAVRHDVDSRVLLRLDGHDGRVVLRLLEKFRGDAPQFAGAHARRKAARQFRAIDEPLRLRVAADDGGGEHFHGYCVPVDARRLAMRPTCSP